MAIARLGIPLTVDPERHFTIGRKPIQSIWINTGQWVVVSIGITIPALWVLHVCPGILGVRGSKPALWSREVSSSEVVQVFVWLLAGEAMSRAVGEAIVPGHRSAAAELDFLAEGVVVTSP
jgi:hypothetical protein